MLPVDGSANDVIKLHEILGSGGGDYENDSLLGSQKAIILTKSQLFSVRLW
jgi:hypothetical protein